MTDTLQDNEIMTRVRDGDVRLLSLLFERHQRPLFQFFFHLTGRRDLSDDLVQEVFFRLLRFRHTYRPGNAFTSWMYQIARNSHIDYLRRKKGEAVPLDANDEQWTEPASDTPHPEEQAQKQQELALLRRAMAKLPPEKRELLVLSRFQNLKYEEIARICGCEVNTVKVRVFRAMRELGQAYFALSGESAT